jgi:hypothetical protein
VRRSIILSLTVLVLLLSAALPVHAGWSWCSTDPHILLPDGRVVHIKISVPDIYRDTALELTVYAPDGSREVGTSGALDVTTTVKSGRDGKLTLVLSGKMEARIEGWVGNASFPMTELSKGNRRVTWQLP